MNERKNMEILGMDEMLTKQSVSRSNARLKCARARIFIVRLSRFLSPSNLSSEPSKLSVYRRMHEDWANFLNIIFVCFRQSDFITQASLWSKKTRLARDFEGESVERWLLKDKSLFTVNDSWLTFDCPAISVFRRRYVIKKKLIKAHN